jgi:AcrR family transcriptional regulator
VAGGTARSAETWIDAAYARFRREGLGAVRVEAVARDIGATKGSFYWHFADRRSLVLAVMDSWERQETEAVIAAADLAGPPRERLTLLFDTVARGASRRRGETWLYVEAEREGVLDHVRRVANRRIGYTASILESAGIPPDEARRRAVLALGMALGLEQLAVTGPTEIVGLTDDALTEAAVRMALAR